jgi:protease I
MGNLTGIRVLIIATNGYAELSEPREALEDAGATVLIAAPSSDPIRGVSGVDLSHMMPQVSTPDLVLHDVDTSKFDALFIPGGLGNPDALRIVPTAVAIVRSFVASGKLVASICHGPWMLIEAGVVEGRKVTGWHSLRTDLTNAGALVRNEAVVRDDNLITSRMPSDIPAFSEAIIQALHEQVSIARKPSVSNG